MASTFRKVSKMLDGDLRKLPLAKVTWVDSGSWSGWREAKEVPRGLVECQTVGWVVTSNRRVLTVVQSLNEHQQVTEAWSIPRSCVRKVQVLR